MRQHYTVGMSLKFIKYVMYSFFPTIKRTQWANSTLICIPLNNQSLNEAPTTFLDLIKSVWTPLKSWEQRGAGSELSWGLLGPNIKNEASDRTFCVQNCLLPGCFQTTCLWIHPDLFAKRLDDIASRPSVFSHFPVRFLLVFLITKRLLFGGSRFVAQDLPINYNRGTWISLYMTKSPLKNVWKRPVSLAAFDNQIVVLWFNTDKLITINEALQNQMPP